MNNEPLQPKPPPGLPEIVWLWRYGIRYRIQILILVVFIIGGFILQSCVPTLISSYWNIVFPSASNNQTEESATKKPTDNIKSSTEQHGNISEDVKAGFHSQNEESPNLSAALSSTQPERNYVTLKAYIHASSDEQKFIEGKIVEWEGYVSGEIEEKIISGEMRYVFCLNEDNYGSLLIHRIYCRLDHTHQSLVSTLKNGDKVKVKGIIAKQPEFLRKYSSSSDLDVSEITKLSK